MEFTIVLYPLYNVILMRELQHSRLNALNAYMPNFRRNDMVFNFVLVQKLIRSKAFDYSFGMKNIRKQK